MILVHFQGKPLNITTIKVHVKTTNAEEPEGDQPYEDLQDHLRLELTSKKLKQTNKQTNLFITEDWNAKLGGQEISKITGKFGLRVQNEAGQMLIVSCQENALVIANTLFQQYEITLNMDITRWSIPKSD